MKSYPALERQGIPHDCESESGPLQAWISRLRAGSYFLEQAASENSKLRALALANARLKTIVGSVQLEGNPLDLGDAAAVLKGQPIPPPFEAQEDHRLDITNHEKALNHIDRRLRSKRRSTVSDLCSIHKLLMKGVLPPSVLGCVRQLPIATYFIETGEKIGDCPDPDELGELMAELESWLDDSRSLDPILRAIGFQFLAREVHPFVAGNRRAARLMQLLLLIEGGENAWPLLSSWEWVAAEKIEDRARLPRAVAQARAEMSQAPFAQFILECACRAIEQVSVQIASPDRKRDREAPRRSIAPEIGAPDLDPTTD